MLIAVTGLILLSFVVFFWSWTERPSVWDGLIGNEAKREIIYHPKSIIVLDCAFNLYLLPARFDFTHFILAKIQQWNSNREMPVTRRQSHVLFTKDNVGRMESFALKKSNYVDIAGSQRGRDMPGVFKWNHDNSFSWVSVTCDSLSIANWTASIDICPFGDLQCSLRRIGSILGSIGSLSSRAHLVNVDYQQSNGYSERTPFNKFFPKWGVIFAPVGLCIGFWGWYNIRDGRRLKWGTAAVVVGCILWGYGFARLITL
jgi:hypothetical protein